MNYGLLAEIWQSHSGKIIGIIIGMLAGISILVFGFFHTIFVMLCMIFGYIIGKRIDENEDIEDIMDILGRILPRG